MNDPFADPDGTREEILGAAFRALCAHGYAELTIQRIGDEFEKSPSLLYHHYDGKDDLLVDLLEFLLDGFEEAVSEDELSGETAGDASVGVERPARDRIVGYVVAMSRPGAIDDDRAPNGRFLRAVVELRAQAAHDGAYRDHFDRSDRVFERFLERTVREAAAEVTAETPDASEVGPGSIGDDPVDPEAVAATVQTIATGGMLRWATTSDRGWVDGTVAGVERYLDATLPRVTLEE
ncbi:TetR family transcriptional regulator [Halorubrum sp. JWXQ-INN 858]|uniref:TetR/AcrR family transcriptional regulator n=1 Tax=Halorubrum sp. JWXQ-INN 858 TaxID=2690782 RepID=UPI00135A9F01|nr:TetR family transcriptional regulator [Halorubrum sp. JWXQ-INN 858]MWV65802.1 TetR family transcriptional regulator [Halorubrum sp. JWXQ-INN 858]